MLFTDDEQVKTAPLQLDSLTLMPNMGITKWSKNYDVIKLTIAIITSSLFYKKKMTEQNLQNRTQVNKVLESL